VTGKLLDFAAVYSHWHGL